MPDQPLTHADLRKNYGKHSLTEEDAGADPITLFGSWLQYAADEQVPEHNAMALATSGPDHLACRIVLLRSFNEEGFVFFTNYNSRKSNDLDTDTRAALNFFWPQLERQIRIEGRSERVGAAESDAYFTTRPRESRIGAWASDQSMPVASRDRMMERYARWEERFKEGDVPRPFHWGGIRVRPLRIEFWQGGPNRMHDRIMFERRTHGDWERSRLQP
ncbi:MAG: pyridoxamine 5'-phosphate oxidase [Flavobacteriales bacterium]